MIELGTLECSGWGKTQSWVSHWRRHSADCLWRRDHEVHSSQLSGLTNAIVQFEAHGTDFVLLHDCFCSSVVELQRAPLLFLFTPQLSQLFPRIRQRDAAMSLLCSSFNLSTLPQFPDLCFWQSAKRKPRRILESVTEDSLKPWPN